MKDYKSTIHGECHCRNISFEFNTDIAVDDLIVRTCQCRFCRAHGAATARDPDGLVSIKVQNAKAVSLYRFATNSTDFVICSICGVYVGAFITHEHCVFATLNINATNLNFAVATPSVYDDESSEKRIERRIHSFTPVIDYRSFKRDITSP